jgi:5-methylthioadenosine/S-adenosylhomocysteine deaminase
MRTARPTLVTNGRVLDIDGDVDTPPKSDILIDDGIIVAVGPDATAAGERLDAVVFDASDRLVIPGLVNAHYHSHDTMLRGMFEQLPLDAWMLYSSPAQYKRLPSRLIELRTALGASECLVNGVTTIQDMVSIASDDRGQLDDVLRAYRHSGIRTVLALQISDRAACDCVAYWDHLPAATMGKLPGAPDPAPLMKLIEDAVSGPAQERLHWGLGPSAPQRCTGELLTWMARLSREHGLQVFTHAYEARSQAVLARLKYDKGSLIEHLDRFGLLNSRLAIAHGVWITQEEIGRVGAAGASIVCNPISNLKLLNGFAPIVEYAQAGATIGLGCDNCSGNDAQNMFESMKMFALTWANYSKAGEQGAAREAFKAATIGAAEALGLGHEIGLIRPGYRADLTMIDLNQANYRPMNSALRQLVYGESGRGVDTVMVAGHIVVEGGKLKNTSDRALKAEAEELKEYLAEDVLRLKQRNADILPDILDAFEQADTYPLDFDRLLLRVQQSR